MIFTRLSRRTQIILVIGAAILVLHLYRQWIYLPMQKKVNRIKRESAELISQMPLFDAQRQELERVTELYQQRLSEVSKRDAELAELEEALPSRSGMAKLLEQLTLALGQTGAEFISLEPTIKKAGEDELFDPIEIEVQFYGSYSQVAEYLKAVEEQNILLGVDEIQMQLSQDVAKKPTVAVRFSSFLSDRAAKQKQKEKEPEVILKPAVEPFHQGSKPYDNRLPGEHHLTMIIWNVGKPVALIDGKVLKLGSVLDNKTLVEIDSDGVWFSENNVRYYLTLET